MMVGDRATDIRRVVSDVVAQAIHDAAAGGVVVLEDWTPEGELAYEWLVSALGEDRVWRAASLASNVHGAHAEGLVGASGAAGDGWVLLAHPASKTALLLSGPLPRADLFPFGDIYASELTELAGGWTVPPALASLIGAAGLAAVDRALQRVVDGREPCEAALQALGEEAADELRRRYEAGRWFRVRHRLVPKLGARTLGIDLFD